MISLIIPNYNKATHLEETLASARAQSAVSQIIVVDDASTDGSAAILRDAAALDPRIDLVRLDQNHNASYCRNLGLERATAPYVIFLDSDDLLAGHCSTVRLELASCHPDHDLWVFPMRVFRDSADHPLDTWIPRPGDHLRHFLAHRLDWQTMQPLWRREFLLRIGGFDTSFARLQDPEMHVRALLAGARVKCFPDVEPDCFYRAFADDAVDAARLSRRSLDASLHFYRALGLMIPPHLRGDLAGTLFACMSQHVTWRRQGRLAAADCAAATKLLADACEIPGQQRILLAYRILQERLPVHVPGINRITRMLLGVVT
jgi:GT2 family glycosyltransferase